MKLGIGTYCYMWSIGFEGAQPENPLTAIGLLERARDLGVSVVQVGPNLPLDKLPDTELDQFIRRAREWDIELELCTRGLETDHLEQQITLTKRVGASLLRTIPEIRGETPSLKSITSYLRNIMPALQAEDVKLGLENGMIPAEDLRWVLEELSSPHLGIVLDTVNSMAIPEGWRYVTKILAPYTICLHVKEFVSQRAWSMMGFTVEGRPASKGQLDIPWLLETLRAADATFNVILELWPPQQETLQATIDLEQAWVVESVRYLRSLIKE